MSWEEEEEEGEEEEETTSEVIGNVGNIQGAVRWEFLAVQM